MYKYVFLSSLSGIPLIDIPLTQHHNLYTYYYIHTQILYIYTHTHILYIYTHIHRHRKGEAYGFLQYFMKTENVISVLNLHIFYDLHLSFWNAKCIVSKTLVWSKQLLNDSLWGRWGWWAGQEKAISRQVTQGDWEPGGTWSVRETIRTWDSQEARL